MTRTWLGLAAVGLLTISGTRPASAAPPPKLDVLVLVDNSNSMGEEQVAFNQAFPAFITQLIGSGVGDVLPDVHIGVISSNMGVGGNNIFGCGGAGDDGVLQATPRIAGCTPPSPEPFIRDELDADGVTRIKNYSGALEGTLACIATLGVGGCGFEQQLAAVRRALDPTNAANAGFLRPDAALAIVIISDEDDCSAVDPTIFSMADQALDGPLGPLSSFRCTEFGVRCDGSTVARAPASYDTCEPRTDSYLEDPRATAAYIKALKSDPSQIVVAVIGAPPSPFTVASDPNGRPLLQPSCSSSFGAAAPAVRLRAFAEAFPARHFFGTICADTYGEYLAQFGSLTRSVLHGTAPPVPPDPPDAGPTAPDAGLPSIADPEPGGCGCAVGSAPAPRTAGALALVALVVLARRRRR